MTILNNRLAPESFVVKLYHVAREIMVAMVTVMWVAQICLFGHIIIRMANMANLVKISCLVAEISLTIIPWPLATLQFDQFTP